MPSNCRKVLLSILSILFLFTAKAQEAALRNSINLNIFADVYEEYQQKGSAELAYEWKPWQYLGLELGGAYGWFRDYDLTQLPVDLGVKQNIDLAKIYGEHLLFLGRVIGYLPLWRGDNDKIFLQFYAAFMGGYTSTIKMEGSLEIFEPEQTMTVSGEYKAHFFNGFELGFWLSPSDKVAMKFFFGGSDNMHLGDAIKDMNKQAGDFPLKFCSYVPSSYLGVSLCLTLPKKKIHK